MLKGACRLLRHAPSFSSLYFSFYFAVSTLFSHLLFRRKTAYEKALKNLNRVNWQVDFVLTHCAPSSVQKKLDRDFTPDRLTDFLETVKERCNFTYWLLGHYHRNCVTDGRFIILWEQMVKLETGQQQGGPLPLRIKFPEQFPRV